MDSMDCISGNGACQGHDLPFLLHLHLLQIEEVYEGATTADLDEEDEEFLAKKPGRKVKRTE